MGWLSWIIMGLICGSLAKWIMPGKDPGGFFMTMVIGIAGGVIGGYISNALGMGAIDSIFSIVDIAFATGGAVLLLFVYRQIKGKTADGG
jgi:uncharacterized membrane protein YeaQ/YmgE (transglycosylase-associated protein family)